MKTNFRVAAALILCALLLASCTSREEIERINFERGSVIVNAVYEYEADHKQFPYRLDSLAPEYLDEVPLTQSGDPFFYNTNSVDGFILSFLVAPHYGCGYSDKFKEWGCGRGD